MAAHGGQKNTARRKPVGFVLAFLAPSVLFYSLFVIWPLIQTILLSFSKYRGLSAKQSPAGLANYEWLYQSDVFWKALSHNGWLLLVSGAAIISLSLLLAHGMQRAGRLSGFLRSIFLFPQVISVVVVAVIWMFLLNPNYGLVNSGLDLLGLDHLQRRWLAQGSTALPSLTAAFIWWALGFYVMLFSAGLQSIPGEIVEAAELDGATGFRRFAHVTWPMLWSIRRIALIYLISNVLNVFALVLVMTKGGPDRATETLLTFLYQTGFEQSNYGRASAIATANLALALVLSGLLFLLTRKNPQEAK